ncbi:DUF6461 domain-containing protein [Streptomyces ipomoeae]|uniref:DUF6461 domain-containing protein n=1 Tax=Streptomyces ipomoeae TaxID=103232 RepID=UPI001146A2B2|nr:DUF6461 domain-containing protein [Streptomyces ipomoeae]TQE35659.1 hypothetical protein Sipo7851_13825 [Streptomyces ipomoeae]
MCDGIGWLGDRDAGLDNVVFAHGVTPEDLAVRMGGTSGSAVELTGPDVERLLHRRGSGESGVVRVGACGDWSYAVAYLNDPTRDDLAVRASRGGVEAIQYLPMPWHPPDQFSYFRDGSLVCAFGVREEAHRWGREPDHLLPVLVAGGVLAPDGKTHPEPEPPLGRRHLTLTALEQHFGLCLPMASAIREPLPAYTIRGDLSLTPDPDLPLIHAWTTEHGYHVGWSPSGHVPASIRAAYTRATGT